MPPWLLTDQHPTHAVALLVTTHATAKDTNSKRSSGVRCLETARGVLNAEVGNTHA